MKVQLYWSEVAPGGRRKPRRLRRAPTPPSYHWGVYDAPSAAIIARGHAALPQPRRPRARLGRQAAAAGAGTYRPSAKEFRLFAQAAGRQFPNVDLWSLWNEPNLYSLAEPAAHEAACRSSPSIYRSLYLAGHDGLSAPGHGGDTILLGELMPRGGTSTAQGPPARLPARDGLPRPQLPPVPRPAARRRGCRQGRAHPDLRPRLSPVHARPAARASSELPDDAAIGQLAPRHDARSTRSRGAASCPRRLPIWITEFGFQTQPPDPFATPLKRAPGLMDLSEWIAFRNPRVASYSQYTLATRPNAGRPFSAVRWQSGLRFADGRAKPGVYDAFRMPLLVRSLGARRGRGVRRRGARRRGAVAA